MVFLSFDVKFDLIYPFKNVDILLIISLIL